MSTTPPRITELMQRQRPAKCPHGYVFAGNCVRCTPPPAYKPLGGTTRR